MQNIKEYIKSVRFSLGYSFQFVPKESSLMLGLYIFAGVLPYANAYLLGTLVNTIVQGAKTGLYTNIWYILIFYAFISALPAIIGNIQIYINRRRLLIMQMEADLGVLKKREQIDIATYENPKFQDLLQRTFKNGINPMLQMSSAQFDAIRSLTSFFVGTILAIHFNYFVYLVIIVAAIPGFLTDIKYGGIAWSVYAKDSPEQRRLSDLRFHLINRTFLIETKLLQSGKKIISWMRDIMSSFLKKQVNLEKNKVWHTSLTDILAVIGFAAGLVLVVRGVISGEILVGSLVYMISTLSSVRNSISQLLENVSSQYENHLIVKDMIEIFNTKPVIVEVKNPIKLSLTVVPEIIFENVSFKYPNSDNWSLKNVSLKLSPGNKIGLVGNNGAGKTTFVKLLCRIYDPTEGRILVNGVDLRDISTKEWWSYLGVMFQDYASYDFVVKEAIAIGRPDRPVNIADVKIAAEISQSHTFIEEWPNTYNQQLGVEFGGKEPSKGQRQKLSIAKVIYRNPFVMILDEPTASVDAESEAKIFDSLENLSNNTTALLISHDFSTISECDQIFVLDKAELIEAGNHKILMKQKGLYAELYNLQAKRFKK